MLHHSINILKKTKKKQKRKKEIKMKTRGPMEARW